MCPVSALTNRHVVTPAVPKSRILPFLFGKSRLVGERQSSGRYRVWYTSSRAERGWQVCFYGFVIFDFMRRDHEVPYPMATMAYRNNVTGSIKGKEISGA